MRPLLNKQNHADKGPIALVTPFHKIFCIIIEIQIFIMADKLQSGQVFGFVIPHEASQFIKENCNFSFDPFEFILMCLCSHENFQAATTWRNE